MEILYKTAPLDSKTVSAKTADGGGKRAQFTGYASTWTRTPDAYGHVVAKGAFAKSLQEWAEKGTPLALLWLHRQDEPRFFIGTVLQAVEDDHGLKVTCELDLENDEAQQVYRLLKTGSVAEMSFAYIIRDSQTIELGGQDVIELQQLDLLEVSVVPIGANRDTSIDEVKARPNPEPRTQEGHGFTPDEVAALKALAAAHLQTTAPEEGEADDNAQRQVEGTDGVKTSRWEEAVARAKEALSTPTG